MLYTRKGDTGTTKFFNSKPGEYRSKASCQTEALGALDELNSFLGLVKVKCRKISWKVNKKNLENTVDWIQNCLFSVQAEVAGANKRIAGEAVKETEEIIDWIERQLPPIKTFFISGGTEYVAMFDISRTLARKAERRVIASIESKECKVCPSTLAFLNRLSSLLYALARLINHKSGIKEVPPKY